MLGGKNEEEDVSAMNKDDNKARKDDSEYLKEASFFYEKLAKMNESSGLTLVFNFREAILDLYLLYKEVTQRGGFNQVTMDRKWDEVAYAFNLKRNDSMLLYQLQMVYQNLLYPYEQTQHYRTPAKAKLSGFSEEKQMRHENKIPTSDAGFLEEKQKRHENALSHLVASNDELDRKAEKRKRTANTSQQESTGPETPEQKKSLKKQQKEKESKKEHNFPVRPRTSYQFFMRVECDRLKKILGEHTTYVNLRTMATEKWKLISESEKQPFIESSKADKERYLQELVAFKLQQEKQDDAKTASSSSPNCSMLNFCTSSQTERDYHVKFDPESGDLVTPPPIEPLIIEPAEMMMRAYSNSTDPHSNINVDEYDYDDFQDPSA